MDVTLLKKFTDQYLSLIGSPQWYKSNDCLKEVLNKIKNYVEACHKQDPDNIDIILRLAISYYLLNEEDIAVSYLDTIPLICPLYHKSLLLRTYIQESWSPFDEHAYDNLIIASRKEIDPEMKSMLLYCASRYSELSFEHRKNLLAQSVTLCDKHVYNIKSLGMLMQSYGQKSLGTSLILDAMRNVIEISLRSVSGDITDSDEFIDKHIKGIHTNQSIFRLLIDCVDPNGFQWMEDLQKKLHSTNEETH